MLAIITKVIPGITSETTRRHFEDQIMLKFKHPQTPEEAAERFRLIEDRGDGLLVEFVCDMRLRPQFVYPAEDLIQA